MNDQTRVIAAHKFRDAGGEASGNGACLGVAVAHALLAAWGKER